jgi:5-oxopent-3-ene-1,2,5-tricarboxylate decarboxylase / 2-hydroxyhepta-2,4-diene-1,7-dioate isomerase
VVIPPSLVVELAAASVQQEAEETWALERVDAGESTIGVFPVSKERRPEFEAWFAAHQGKGQ